jgi:hypothetical protein
MRAGGRDALTSTQAEEDSTRQRASHTDEDEQPSGGAEPSGIARGILQAVK